MDLYLFVDVRLNLYRIDTKIKTTIAKINVGENNTMHERINMTN